MSPSYLFDDHDGHVMPAAFLIAGGITRLAPLNWLGPAISLVVLQLVASLALLRALRVILGQFADEALASQRAVPGVLRRHGFTFQDSTVESALRATLA